MEFDYLSLQNGSDIRGIALEGVEGEAVNLTEERIKVIGRSFLKWLKNKVNKDYNKLRVGIGNDSRLSAHIIKKALIEELTNYGVECFDLGLSTTPAMFMSTVVKGYEYDGSIMITASHLPFNRNGLKFFTKIGGLEKKDISEILTECNKGVEVKVNNLCSKEVRSVDFLSVYANILKEKIIKEANCKRNYERPLSGLRIIVDAGNGAGGFFAEKVIKELGGDITGSQYLDPDGRFPNHIPNPENKEAMRSICEAVKKRSADLGIIFDTDVDRAAVVSKNGEEINRNRLIALISTILIEECKGATIVTDSITSDGLTDFIEKKLGGKHHRFKRGYKNVINEAIRLNNEGIDCPLAIETSGHAALRENYFLDDGAYLVAKILIKLARLNEEGIKDISYLIKDLKEPLESVEYRFNIKEKNFKEYGEKVINGLSEFIKDEKGWSIVPNNYEGIRVACDRENGDGWFLLRMSLHDPVMPLNIESNSKGGVELIYNRLLKYFSRYELLDLKK